MRFTQEEKSWINHWVNCYECPSTEECTEEKPCENCKIQTKISKKTMRW